MASVTTAFATASLLLAVAGCHRSEQRLSPARNQRTIAPRLTIAADPEATSAMAGKPCDERATDHAHAVQVLHAAEEQKECLDAAIERLQHVARQNRSGPILSDLSAAHFIRAVRDGGAVADLLSALDTAEEAVRAAPDLPEARFNRALAREALALENAAEAWREAAAADESSWAAQAEERRKALDRAAAVRMATQWAPERIADLASAGDDTALATLIAHHPSAAQRYLEEDLLPQWATANAADASPALARAHRIATHLASHTKDRYVLAAVEVIRGAKAPELADLREGHLAFRDGRLMERVQPSGALGHYRRAQELFARAGSPLQYGARLGEIIALSFTPEDRANLISRLTALDQVAHARNYTALQARIASNLANCRVQQSLYVDAIEAYDAAIVVALRMHDDDTIAATRARKAGVLRHTGRHDEAAREALRAAQREPAHPDILQRHYILGEAAENALALHHPEIALLYANKAVDLLQRTISDADDRQATMLRDRLAIALRTRVSAHLALNRHDEAIRDVNEVTRLAATLNNADEHIRRVLLTRTYESAGQAALKTGNALQAVQAFDEALRQALPDEYRTYRALLLVQRARALASAGRQADARQSLLSAVAEIRTEQRGMLQRRMRGDHEAFWTSYFSRFRETYDALIRYFFDAKDYKEAFTHAESFRAYEPLDLVLRRSVAPESFRRWAGRGALHPVADIQRHLNPDQYFISFYVLPDRTYVWIVGANVFEALELPIGDATIETWNAALRRHDAESDGIAFESVLEQAHAGLLAKPLERVRALTGGASDVRIVFAPDRGLHGLPIAALRHAATRRYVVEDFIVSITPSAALYVFSRERDEQLAQSNERSVLLIGDPAFDRHLELTKRMLPLPWARSEVARIRRLYGPSVTSLDGARATVPAFFREIEHHAIVHFAGHAIANPAEPFHSLLLLARGGGHTGVLQADELLKTLKTDRTRLLVLASCSSSGGTVIGQEGLAPLVRPFMTSGVPAVLGTLWNVRDEYSEAVLVAFHEHYRRGLDAESALRQAQLGLIRTSNPARQSPLAWAPFQVVGHAESPFR